APMGAIVRKGGFGYPLLIAVGFFMVYMVLTIFSKNIAERFVIDPVLAAWLPCLVLFPIGLLLTYQAMNDYTRVINLDRYTRLMKFFRWVGRIASFFSRFAGG
ncbi:MAG: LptF/LptG family permease, partial [Bacteroidota bacterium]